MSTAQAEAMYPNTGIKIMLTVKLMAAPIKAKYAPNRVLSVSLYHNDRV